MDDLGPRHIGQGQYRPNRRRESPPDRRRYRRLPGNAAAGQADEQREKETGSHDPTHDMIAPVIFTIPLQLLAYHVAVMKGTDIDQPRNLAKSVTVE